ncbi:MAG: bifunctional homocysteine S-methyltransferase/methylenetetrahydrofolate reductase [Lentisphaeria bacterium]|nr:bifunctional homocysteine S-methyltransferase/methylenetetrahydrofolate reductase [Lentisphaeria bacterium]
MTDPLRELLKKGLVIFDGAMGTEIYRRNFFVNASYEQLCLTRKDVILDIHRQYIAAGAEVLTTNTFNANARRLAKFGIADQTCAINRAGVALARQAAGGKALVAGSAGPVGEPESPADTRSRADILAEQLSGLTGSDFIIFESLRTRQDLDAAVEAVQSVNPMPYVLSFAADLHASTNRGEDGLDDFLNVIERVSQSGYPPTAIGLNCGSGPEATLTALEYLAPKIKLPVIVQPNAGAPRNIDGRMLYMTSNEYFSTYARRYVQLGASAIGGCCGITPAHIEELVRTVKPLVRAEQNSAHTNVGYGIITRKQEQAQPVDPVPLRERSKLGAKLASGQFITTVEITPPRGFDLAKTIAGARLCAEAKVDAVNLPDGPRASARISPLVTAIAIERETGIETIPHCCCRDKSLIGLQAELLGYAGAGIHNLLFITGDPPKLGDYPSSTGVFDIDSIGLAAMQNNMNKGLDLGNQSLNAPTSVVIGVGADPNALAFDRECDRIRRKADAGADFIITQPVFDPEVLFRFMDAVADTKLPVIAGVWPLTSFRNAQFMHDEVPGVVVPDSIMQRMASSPDRDSQRREGIAIARDTVAIIRDRVSGVQISAPFGNVSFALEVLK